MQDDVNETQQQVHSALQKGEVDKAWNLLQQILLVDHTSAFAYFHIAHILHSCQQEELAAGFYQKGLQYDDTCIEAHARLGTFFFCRRQWLDAQHHYACALQYAPDEIFYHHQMGVVLHKLQRHEEAQKYDARAIEYYEQSAQENPKNFHAHYNLGALHLEQGRYRQAAGYYVKALQCDPTHADSLLQLGFCFQSLQEYAKAEQLYQKAIALRPSHTPTYSQLSFCLIESRHYAKAIIWAKKAIAVDPHDPELFYCIGYALRKQELYHDALFWLQKALQLNPSYAMAYYQCGVIYHRFGDSNKACDFFQKAMSLPSLSAIDFSAILFLLHYNCHLSAEEIFQYHLQWNARYVQPLTFVKQNSIKPLPSLSAKKIRIGYISGDLQKQHPVHQFFLPILSHHDRNQFEVFCYPTVDYPLHLTKEVQNRSDHWHSLANLSDQEAFEKIQNDRIDLLVELSGHSGNHRLLLLARKPAPVQISYLGYADTSGMNCIDYRLTDQWADLPEYQKRYTEKLIFLPQGFLTYAVNPSVIFWHRKKSKVVRFGCMNAIYKINANVILLWSKILHATPRSILKIKLTKDTTKEMQIFIIEGFKRQKISSNRIHFLLFNRDKDLYWKQYQEIDIALDTFPYNGTTTTCDTLWMGVPLISLAGDRHISRTGVSILHQIGAPELVAQDAEHYVQLAVALAKDPKKRVFYHKNLRALMQKSTLCDAKRFALQLEETYTLLWQKHMAAKPR